VNNLGTICYDVSDTAGVCTDDTIIISKYTGLFRKVCSQLGDTTLAACFADYPTYVYQLATGANTAELSCVPVTTSMTPGSTITNTGSFAPFWVTGCNDYVTNSCGDVTSVGSCNSPYTMTIEAGGNYLQSCVSACEDASTNGYLFSSIEMMCAR